MPHVAVNELPPKLIRALESVRYFRKDISVEVKSTVSLICSGGQGYRGFALIVNLYTGETKEFWGSWGGANMFNPQNVVDLDRNDYALPENCAVVKGSQGETTFAHIVIPPSNAAPWLPAKDDSLTDKDRAILDAIGGLKSGPYRKEGLARLKTTDADIDNLVSKGYLKRAVSGSVQITTSGKNARRK